MKRWSAMAKAFTNWKDIVMAVKKAVQIRANSRLRAVIQNSKAANTEGQCRTRN
jgi:transcriptional/translational regulatory protein YebC/TACO1